MSERLRKLRAAAKGASRSNAGVIRQAEAAANELFNGLTLESRVIPQDIALSKMQEQLREVSTWQFMLGANSIDDLAYMDRGDWVLVCFGPATALRLDAYICVLRSTTVRRARYEYRDYAWRLVDSGPNAA